MSVPRKTPWPSISIHRGQLHHDICQAVSRPGLFRDPNCSTSPPAKQSQEANVLTRIWQFGEICSQEQSEPRISGDILQWTGRYSIALGRSRAPSASLDLPPAISTRSSLSSHCRSTRTQKVHAFPLTRKRLSFPLLRKSLSVFLGPGFSWVSNMCNGISPWIFSYSNAAATIQVLHCRLLAYFASIKFARTC